MSGILGTCKVVPSLLFGIKTRNDISLVFHFVVAGIVLLKSSPEDMFIDLGGKERQTYRHQ